MKKLIFMFVAAMVIASGLNKANAQYVPPTVPEELEETVQSYINTLLENPIDESVMKAIEKNKLIKKNKAALIAFGYRCLDHDILFNMAIGMAKKVYEMDAAYLPAVYLEGDAFFKMGKKANNSQAMSMASTKYEEAKQLDPNSLDPYLKLVGVYRYINPDYAIELMSEIKEKKTDDPKINQVLGTLYYQLADTVNARKYYNMYFEKFPDGQGDVTVQREYVIILFMAKDYTGALNMTKKFQATSANDPVLNRVAFLANYELEQAYTSDVENQFKQEFETESAKYAQATKAAHDKFFGQYPDSVYQELDLRYLAMYKESLKDYAAAKTAWLKAIEKDKEAALLEDEENPSYSPLLPFRLSKCCEKTKDFDEAIGAYKNYMELVGKKDDVNELFQLGRLYQRSANGTQQDSLLRVKYINEGDAIFAQADKKMSDEGKVDYQGVYWRARINMFYDTKHPNKIASGFFRETAKRLEDAKYKSEDYDAHRAQAYSYVAWYEMEQENFAEASQLAELALKYEDDNTLATNVKTYVGYMKDAGKW